MELYAKIAQLVVEMEEDTIKFYTKGNSSAGRRVRKQLLEMKSLAHQMRMEISSLKNEE